MGGGAHRRLRLALRGLAGRFHPHELPQREELAYASRRFDAIEVNGTFYSLQSPDRFGDWHDQTPRGFRFAVNGNRYVTHMKRIRDVAPALANFFASGALRLEEKLGPVLWQLPASSHFDAQHLDDFLALLPELYEQVYRHADAIARADPSRSPSSIPDSR